MSVVAASLYRNGEKVRAVTIDQPIELAEDGSEFVWIGIADPTPAELHALAKCYGLHPLAVEDALKGDQLPKIDVFGEQLFVVGRTAYWEGAEVCYAETAMFVGRGHIISVRHGSSRAHTALREQLEAAPALLVRGTDYVLHAILDFIVDGYLLLIQPIEDEVLSLEDRAVERFLNRGDVNRIFTLRRELIRFQRTLGPMGEVANKLARHHLPCIDEDARVYFGDVLDHVRRVQAMVDGLREVLTSVFEFGTLLEQQRTGAITRQLAAWAAILAVPTAIAGIYGMNFEHMPELNSPYGYFIVIGVIAVVSVSLFVRFKKKGWL